jgi:hypothetical protein
VGVLESIWIAQLMKESSWLYPAVETLHICGLGLLFGVVVMMDLRLLGVGRGLDARRLSALGVPMAIAGLTLAAFTGFFLFIASADELIDSTLFLTKISLIFLLLLNAVSVRMREADTRSVDIGWGLRVQAVLSMAGWLAVIAMGRWLAYV